MSKNDFVREIRLRQWAVRNFVLPEFRNSNWHPVVLDEMQRKDRELSQAIVMVGGDHESEMDLSPSAFSEDNDAADHAVADDAMSRESFDPNQQKSRGSNVWSDSFHDSIAGSKIVPLFPDGAWGMHPAVSEVPRPHCRSFIDGAAAAGDVHVMKKYS